GKHLVIDYSVALEKDGRIKAVEVLEYREPHGGEITSHSWLEQFVGKTSRDPVTLDRDIRNISGATLSSQHVTEGVKRILAFYQTCPQWGAPGAAPPGHLSGDRGERHLASGPRRGHRGGFPRRRGGAAAHEPLRSSQRREPPQPGGRGAYGHRASLDP